MESDRQSLGVIALAAARLALDPDIRKEVHFDSPLTVALTRLAAATRHVKAESPGRIAAELRLRQLGEELADQLERAGVGGGVARRRIAQRLLIDANDLVDMLQAFDFIVLTRHQRRAVQLASYAGVQNLVDQRALAAAAGAGDGRERSERDFDVDVFEVVVAGAGDAEGGASARVFLAPRFSFLDPSFVWNFNLSLTAQKRSGDRTAFLRDLVCVADGDW